jgi:Tfp pilus assembly protein PilF
LVGLDSGHARARAGWGLSLLQLGHLDEARPQLESALELDPEAADVHAGLGAIAAVEGPWPETFHHNRQALTPDPGQRGAANNLAWIPASDVRG